MKTFFVFLDILGFKNIVLNNSQEELLKIITSFFSGFNSAIDESRSISDGNASVTKIKLNEMAFRMHSDSIIIWTLPYEGNDKKETRFTTFMNLLEAVSELLKFGLLNGLPLRGILHYGELIIHNQNGNDNCFLNNECIYGKVLTEAYQMEGEMNWSGAVITPIAWDKIREIWTPIRFSSDDPNVLFYRYPYLTWYDVPLKKGDKQKRIAINWNYLYAWFKTKKCSEDKIKTSFSAFNRIVNDDVRNKIENTINFLNYTNSNAEKFHINHAIDSIAIPDEKYGIN